MSVSFASMFVRFITIKCENNATKIFQSIPSKINPSRKNVIHKFVKPKIFSLSYCSFYKGSVFCKFFFNKNQFMFENVSYSFFSL